MRPATCCSGCLSFSGRQRRRDRGTLGQTKVVLQPEGSLPAAVKLLLTQMVLIGLSRPIGQKGGTKESLVNGDGRVSLRKHLRSTVSTVTVDTWLRFSLRLRLADAADALKRHAAVAHHMATVSKGVLLLELLPPLEGVHFSLDAALESFLLYTLELVELVDQAGVRKKPGALERVGTVGGGGTWNMRAGPGLMVQVGFGLGHGSEVRCRGGASHVERHDEEGGSVVSETIVSMVPVASNASETYPVRSVVNDRRLQGAKG